METSDGGAVLDCGAERSDGTAFASGGAEADGPGSRFARSQSGGAAPTRGSATITLPARILGRGTSRAREHCLKFQIRPRIFL